MLIDSHAHLDVPAYDSDRDEVIARARQSGIELILEICGSDVARGSLSVGLSLAEEHRFIYAAVGIHPHESSLYDDELEEKLRLMSRRPKVIAVMPRKTRSRY
jgi:TatD DNase family protein